MGSEFGSGGGAYDRYVSVVWCCSLQPQANTFGNQEERTHRRGRPKVEIPEGLDNPCDVHDQVVLREHQEHLGKGQHYQRGDQICGVGDSWSVWSGK